MAHVHQNHPPIVLAKEKGWVATVAEYKIAASVSTRTIGIIVLFVARIAKILWPIAQIRYDSNPELKRLVVIVKTTNAAIHCPCGLVKMSAEPALACAI